MSKKKIFALVLILIFGGYSLYQLFLPNDFLVNRYKYRYQEMTQPDNQQKLREFCTLNLKDSIENKNWTELLKWESKHLRYYDYYLAIRPEEPIAILTTNLGSDGIALGRCGEFALLFTGLCLANNVPIRLVVDCSVTTLETYKDSWLTIEGQRSYSFKKNKGIYLVQENTIKIQADEEDWIGNVSVTTKNIYFMDNIPETGKHITIEFMYLTLAGDHVWNEILINNRWTHLDTTVICQELRKNPSINIFSSSHFNNPKMYVQEWQKVVNKVYAITDTEVIDVTETYS